MAFVVFRVYIVSGANGQDPCAFGLFHGKFIKSLLRVEEVGMSKNVEIIGLSDLKPDPQNARKHTPRNVAMVADALQEVGAARSIVILSPKRRI
jgi:hypothetical protein